MEPRVAGAQPGGGSRVVLAEPAPGINQFATPQWWATHDSELGEAGIVSSARTTSEADTVLVVTTPLRQWLHGDLNQRLTQLSGWEERLLGWCEYSPVLLLVATSPPGSVADLVIAAGGKRYPVPESDTPATVPTRYRTELTERIGAMNPAASGTRTAGIAEATQAIALASDADPELTASEAATLRARSVDALVRLRITGVQVHGCREALRWPAPLASDRVPVAVAAGAALEVLHGAAERCDVPDPNDADDLAQLETEVRQRRATLKAIRAEPTLQERSFGSLLRALVARHG